MRRFLCAVLVLVAGAVSLLMPVAATVNSSVNKTIALGDGVTTVFSFSFIGVATAYITVIFTDASGNETVLTQGSGTTQYQIALNAPVQGAIWGLGGRVTYNPSGAPIAAGTTLTIFRTLPLTQAITLQNQASIATLGKGAETGLDTGVMQGQQIAETIGRALQMNITNTVAPAQLPPAAQAAGLGLCFDGTGNNVIACSLAPSGAISSAMAPVVSAASLAAGRLAFGLGSMALENINGGTCGGATIQDDGSAGGANGVGYARVVFGTVQDATNQTVTCAYHGTQRIATGPITYALPRSSTLFNGFAFRLNAVAGIVSLTPNAADNFPGVASGTVVAIPNGSACDVKTNGASSGVWYLTCNSQNASLAANASANALTIALSSPPVAFRNTTVSDGSPLWALPAGGLSITIPNGATLGVANSVQTGVTQTPFRVWIFLAYNSGTPVLGVATCSNIAVGLVVSIYSCQSWEYALTSGTLISGGADNGGTLYTSLATATDSIRIVGYLNYSTGLATPGTWASNPSSVQVCLPPFTCPKPGSVVQEIVQNTGAVATGTTATSVADTIPTSSQGNLFMSQAITPSARSNLLQVEFQGPFSWNNTGTAVTMLLQDVTTNALTAISDATGAANTPQTFRLLWTGVANTATATTFKINSGNTGGNTHTFNGAGGTRELGGVMNSYMRIREIMGALEPANDNSLPLSMVG